MTTKLSGLEIDVLLLKLDKIMQKEMRARAKSPARISIQDVKVFRLAHHEHCRELGQYNQIQIAEILDVSQQVVSDALERVEKIAPQLFPILSPIEAECTSRYLNDGQKVTEIARDMRMSETAVRKAFRRVKDKGMRWPGKRGRLQRYKPYMDKHVQHRF